MKHLIYIALLLLFSCQSPVKKIFYVNSYHPGYGSSDQVQEGIVENIDTTIYAFEMAYLNAKKASEAELANNAETIWNQIKSNSPDLLIVSDDNAVQSIVVPHLKELDIPILFCGVNWSAEKYNLPFNQVSGMLEILPVEASLDLIKKSGWKYSKITILSENSAGEIKNKETLTPLLTNRGLEVNYQMVDDFDAWKRGFKESQSDSSNIVFLPTNGAIKNWNNQDATSWVQEHLVVPVFTCDDFMVPYATFGLTKVAKEQGEWVVKRAIEILEKKIEINNLSVANNSQFECFLNEPLMEQIGLNLGNDVRCKSYQNE